MTTFAHRAKRFWCLAATITIVQAVFILYSRTNDYFFLDDFLGFIVAKTSGLTRAYLLHDVFGQLAPGYRLLDYAYIRFIGLHYTGVRLFDIATIAVTTVFVLVIARAWRAHAAVVAITLVFIPFSPVFSVIFQWLSAALHALSGLTVGAAALACFAPPRRIGWSERGAGAALLALSLMFYAKMLFLTVLIFGLRVLALSETGRSLRQSTREAIPDVLLLVPIGIAYLTAVAVGHYSSGRPPEGVLPVLRFIQIGLTDGFASNLFGLDPALPWRRSLACALLFLPVAVSAIRNPKTIVVWLCFFAQFLLAAVAIAWGRVTLFGPEVAALSRYYPDTAVLYGICVIVTMSASARRLSMSPAGARTKRFVAWAACAAAALIWLALCRASLHAALLDPDDDGRIAAYVVNFRDSLSKTACRRIYNGTVPDWILPAWTAPLNHVREFALLFETPACFDDAKSGAVVIDQLGRVQDPG